MIVEQKGRFFMINWMHEFLNEFPGATERISGMRQNHEAVETLVSGARHSGEITPETLHVIEDSDEWNYPIWWPLLSKDFGNPIKLPGDLVEMKNRQRAIEVLFDRLHHIEVVSVLLRFILPEYFGIISPPVTFLLNLPHVQDHVSYYMNYLQVLQLLGDHYYLPRIADVDMALWSAAHSQKEFPGIAENMYQDEYFQEMRLRNVFEAFGGLHTPAPEGDIEKRRLIQHLLIARAFLSYDHVLAALICGRSCESLIDLMCIRWGIPRGVSKAYEGEVRNRLRKMGQHEELKELGLSLGALNSLWDWRNRAVHPENRMSRKEASEYAGQLSELCRRFFSA
jgi:hypothetical protein